MRTILLVAFLFAAVLSNLALAQDKPATVTGTVVDTYCLIAMDMSGKNHKKCAEACAKNGVPIGILEEKTGVIYLAQSQKDMLYAPPALIEYLEEKVTVKGKVYEKGEMKVILVESVSRSK